MTRVVCTDLNTDALLAMLLERLSKDGVVEVHGEGRYVSTVALVVATIKAEHTDSCVVSNVSSSALVDEDAPPLPAGVDPSPENELGPLHMTVCLRSVAPSCKKVQARARSYTTLRTSASIPRTDSTSNSPTNLRDVSNSPQPSPAPPGPGTPPPALPPPQHPEAVSPAVVSPEAAKHEDAGTFAPQPVFPPGATPVFPDGMPAELEEPPSIPFDELHACMPSLPQNVDFHELFHKCCVTGERPAKRLFPKHCKAFSEAEAAKYYEEHPDECIAICYDLSDYSEVAWNYKAGRWTTTQESFYFEDLIEALYDTKGAFMVEPVTDKHIATVTGPGMLCASCTMQGWRSSNEDAHAAVVALPNNPNVSLFGVYDGHGGWRVADYTGRNLHNVFDEKLAAARQQQPLTPDTVASVAQRAFLDMDEACQNELSTDHSGSTGSTVNVVLVLDGAYLIVANAGDSRAVLCRDNRALRLSHDHKPDSPRELARIKNSGSRVCRDARVEGMLAVSRAVGDFDFKQAGLLKAEEQAVTANPALEVFEITPADAFIVQACDGIWDVMSDEQVIGFVRERLVTLTPAQICAELCDACLSPTIESEGIGTDNMTVNIIVFKRGQ
eukprot:TRINITY_DN22817_c0_g1_i1.p1 TRINITY_DN22817_c0_g1~~TRINITY_DN22817_c0_g1_i1.p1  ORF type:complete len:664 (+),score=214.98 TRINITY_DN22817_c0_g1_i1:159-1994(+)